MNNNNTQNNNMKNIPFIIGFSFLLFLNQGCSKKGDGQQFESGKTILVQFDPDKYPPLDSFISEITVIPLETNEKCLLRDQFHGVKVHKGLIYFNNMAQELYVFDMNGKFIREISSRGPGPGQFSFLHDFIFTDEGTIELLDYQKIECFTLEGEHIGTKRFNTIRDSLYLNPVNFCRSFTFGYYFWGGMRYGNNTQQPQNENLLYRLNSDMQIEAGFLDTKFGDGGTENRFKYYQNRILFVRSSIDYNVYQIDSNDSLSIRYTFDFGKYGIKVGKDDDKTTVPADVREDYVFDMHKYEETDHYLSFNFRYKTLSLVLLYSKATGQTFIKSYWPASNGKEMRLYTPYATYNDQLVAVVQIPWLKMDLERMSLENIKKWGLEKYQNLNDDDNQILILYKTKF